MAGSKVTFRLAFPTDPRPPTVRSRENCPWAPLASCVSQSHGSPCPSPSPQGHGGSEKDNPQESRAGSEARAGPRSRQPHAPSVPPTAPPPPPSLTPWLEGTATPGNRCVLYSVFFRGSGSAWGPAEGFSDGYKYSYRQTSLTGGGGRGVLWGELESVHSHRETEMK